MIDAIDELVSRSQDHVELRKFQAFHRLNPHILDFLVTEIRRRIAAGFGEYSIASLWHYSRWKLQLKTGPTTTYQMNDHLAPFYGRAITILHPQFNGLCEFRTAKADAIFGTMVEPELKKRRKNYARKLQWADGTSLEAGWRPGISHVVKHPATRKPDIHPR